MKPFIKRLSAILTLTIVLSACGGGGSGGGGGAPPAGGGGGGGGGGLTGWIASVGLGTISNLTDGLTHMSCPKGTTVCFAAGPASIQKSTDGGKTWVQVHSFSSNNPAGSIADVSFVDANTGFVARSYAGAKPPTSLWQTADGGATWMAVTSTLSATPAMTISFADATHGVATAVLGAVYYTTDGGQTFKPSALPVGVTASTANANKPAFVNSTTAFSVGALSSTGYGVLIKTTDAGQNWTDVPLGISGTFYANQLSFPDSLYGFIEATIGAAGGQVILATNDGGTTWTQHPAPFGNFALALSLSCYDTIHCLASTINGVWGSKDGGVNWAVQASPFPPGFSIAQLALTGATHGVAVGSSVIVTVNPVGVTYDNIGMYTDTQGF